MAWYCLVCSYSNELSDGYCSNCGTGSSGASSLRSGPNAPDIPTGSEIYPRGRRYRCNLDDCASSSGGFATTDEVTRHRIIKHKWARCEEQGCADRAYGGGYMPLEDLYNHQKSVHSYAFCHAGQNRESEIYVFTRPSPTHPQKLLGNLRGDHGYARCSECSSESLDTGLMSPKDLIFHLQICHRNINSPRTPTGGPLAPNSDTRTSVVQVVKGKERPRFKFTYCMSILLGEVIIVILNLGVGVAWSISTKPPDIQSGFTIGAFGLVAGTTIIGGIRHIHGKKCACYQTARMQDDVELDDMNTRGE